MSELENITILFHDTYEEVSKKYGYQTRKDTKVFDMESPNGKTMYETVEKIMTPYLQELERYKNIIDEAIESIERGYVVFCEQDEQCLLNFRKNLLKILKGE